MQIVLRFALLGLALLLAASALFGSVDKAHREGANLMLLLSAIFALYATFYQTLIRLYTGRLGRLLLLPLAAAVLCCAAALAICLYGLRRRAHGSERFLLVLGTALDGDEPSVLLRGRLEAALAFLRDNPNAVVVVSGGRVGDERVSEGSVMRRWLLERGVEPSRIQSEEVSCSTYDNFLLSLPILRRMGWREGDGLAVSTDPFHFCRAESMARLAGCSGIRLVPTQTNWFQAANWCFRELLALLKYRLEGAEAMRPPEQR